MECKRSGFGRSSNDDEGYIGHNTKNSNNDATTGPQESINEGKIPIRNLILLYIVCFLFEFSLSRSSVLFVRFVCLCWLL